VRSFRLVLALAAATAALAVPGAAHAEYDCPGRHSPTEPLEPYVCAGTTTDGWGGSLYAYAGTCVSGECTYATVPVEDFVIAVATVVNDVWDDITP
jgi:hypothetical protein